MVNTETKYFRRPPPTTREPPPPLPTAKPHSISIGSKLAATFGHSRLPKPSNYTQATRPSTLSPSTSRAASYESGSSNGSRPRSTTPRPSQPLITVSLSPDNVSEYKNLFTRPQPDSDIPPSPSSPTPNSRFQKSDTPIYPRRGQTPASAIAAAHRQATTDDRPPSRSSRYSRKNSDSDKETLGASSGAQESPRPDGGEKVLPPSLQRRSSSATGSVQDANNPRLRIKSQTTHVRSRPPSIPLPQTPVPNSPLLEIPLSDSFHAELEATGAQKTITRARAHTIGSLPATAQLPSKTTAALDLPEANFDIETASAPQLRAALKIRNRQYDDLVKMIESNAAKLTSMEKKILSLDQEVAKKEKEVSRKDKELKGLRWIINNGDSSQPQPIPAGVLNHALLSPTSTLSESDQDRVVPGSPRRVYYQSDSGTESHAESMSIRSAASGSESVSSNRHKGARKPSGLGEVTYNFYRNASTRRPSKMPPGLGAEKTIPEMPASQHNRTSLNSVSPSPSSSTSSLLPPSPSITMSSLSAIPEGPLPSALRPGVRYDNSDQEERRALRASHRVSTSSMTSSSTAASSSAYSGGNIKRSRPPSIAQVLEKSPIMDDVLEKLRPFA